MQPLETTTAWAAPTVAAAVLRGSDVIEHVGPTSTPFRLASVTKFLTAVVAAVAVEEGTLGLDEPMGPPGSTARHLLAHASGLGVEAGDPTSAVASKRLYSNQGFEVLGDGIGTAAAMPFTEYWHEALVGALGLEATALQGSPAHAATSSVDDLARVVGALIDGTLLAPATVDQLRTAQFPALDGILPGFGRQTPNPWGLGVEIRGRKQPHWTGSANSDETWGHFGQAGTFVWIDPAVHLALIVLTDRDFGPWAKDAWPALADAVVTAYA